MNISHTTFITKPTHTWLRRITVAYVPGPTTPLLEKAVQKLLQRFERWGHTMKPRPDNETDVLITTATFGKPLRWRDALLFTARRRFNLDRSPIIFTLLHAVPEEFKKLLDHFAAANSKQPPDPTDYEFPGLTAKAYHTLHEQGRRGGPILSLVRVVQTQAKSIRVILFVGHDQPKEAYTFDLVGAHPRTDASDADAFYEDLVMRIATAVSTDEVTDHKVVDESITREEWNRLSTPPAMLRAGRELGKRSFFTEMVRIDNLAHIPVLQDAVSSQYSEGCFATWDPELGALIATVTGSARPVEKDNLTEDELAVIVGVREDGLGALVRHVEGKRNDPPSSEAVELIEMDARLPRITLGAEWDIPVEIPIARSKLHGHRGVEAYDPKMVEHVYLEEPYYHYPVSCSTEAQARAIQSAFSRSEALNNPHDQRQVVFTMLPGHGIVIVEKWVPGKEPFQVMWEYMDARILRIESRVPQGPLTYIPNASGMMVLRTF